ncbi:hypothetical protein QBC45DRAFT_382078 [Copromyces sp. CBS 386.78]|nr:hypothetical protein QBC45DRAFT_382078 [Copromyces sp. CBS 386.78]
MAGYGGYGGGDAGGFMAGSQQGGSQAGGSKYADESLRPVTIKQLLDWEDTYPGVEPAIDGHPVTQVTIVGQVRSVKPQPTNITYRIDDGTGAIDVKKWVDSEAQGEGENGSGAGAIGPDAFVRVWGRLKSLGGKKHISANFIRQIEDFNEVNYHLLEATYVHLFFSKGASAAGGVKQEGGGDNMFVDQGYGAGAGGGDVAMGGAGPGGGNSAMQARLATCSRNAQTICNFINNSPGGTEGVNLHVIAQGTRMNVRDIVNAADELLGQGIIYTTQDDETWAILDY